MSITVTGTILDES